MILRTAIALVIFAYGLMFLHLSVFTLIRGWRDFNSRVHSATALDFSLLCLSGAVGIYLDSPGPGFYIAAFILFCLLAPLGTAYALEYLGDDRKRLFLRPILILTLGTIALGLLAGTLGLPWRKVVCIAYALIILSLGAVGLIQFKALETFDKLARQLKIFISFYWFIVFQVCLMLAFQLLGQTRVVQVLCEPPRDCRRLKSLRGYGHGQGNQVFTRSTGASGPPRW